MNTTVRFTTLSIIGMMLFFLSLLLQSTQADEISFHHLTRELVNLRGFGKIPGSGGDCSYYWEWKKGDFHFNMKGYFQPSTSGGVSGATIVFPQFEKTNVIRVGKKSIFVPSYSSLSCKSLVVDGAFVSVRMYSGPCDKGVSFRSYGCLRKPDYLDGSYD